MLYKQDVDLGFSLDQEQIINASYASGNSAVKNRDKDSSPDAEKKAKSDDDTDKHASNKDNANDNDDDDIEKLKALEELREDKVRYWTGKSEFHNNTYLNRAIAGFSVYQAS